jgi:hypothetical protein
LLDWGFATTSSARPVGTLNAIRPIESVSSNNNNNNNNKAASGTATPASAAGSSPLRWLAWTLFVLLALVCALRARVLVKRRIRRRHREANLRLARRLHAKGVKVSHPPDARLPLPHVDDTRETRVGRSA